MIEMHGSRRQLVLCAFFLTDMKLSTSTHHDQQHDLPRIVPHPTAEESDVMHSRSRDHCRSCVSLHSEQTGLLPAFNIAPLQRVQNVAARPIKDHVTRPGPTLAAYSAKFVYVMHPICSP